MPYCPNCDSFEIECNPEPGDYDRPCGYFRQYVEEEPNPQYNLAEVMEVLNRISQPLDLGDFEP